MRQITTIEEFWEAIDACRNEKGLTWKKLMGANAELAASGKMNPTLNKLIDMQETLGIDLFHLVNRLSLDPEVEVIKDPETPKKMEQIYQLTLEESWIEDEALVQKVQELGTTIV